jgi:hypothetical protein
MFVPKKDGSSGVTGNAIFTGFMVCCWWIVSAFIDELMDEQKYAPKDRCTKYLIEKA